MKENYLAFWTYFRETSLYKRIRKSCLEDASSCLLLMEFYSFLQDAQNFRQNSQNSQNIQDCINIIFMSFEHDEKDKKDFTTCLETFNLEFSIPDKDFIDNNFYDKESNKIISKKPFDSWVLFEGKWVAPIKYPTDGKIYLWNEEVKNWIEK